MIAVLVENVGVDKVVRLGHPDVWRAPSITRATRSLGCRRQLSESLSDSVCSSPTGDCIPGFSKSSGKERADSSCSQTTNAGPT